MIKIIYNGYTIEVDSVAQARELMTGETKQLAEKKRKVGRPFGVRRMNKRKGFSSNRWTVEEAKHLIRLIETNSPPSYIKRDSILRDKHTKGAIAQMCYNITKNYSNKVSEEIGLLIAKYHAEQRNVPINRP